MIVKRPPACHARRPAPATRTAMHGRFTWTLASALWYLIVAVAHRALLAGAGAAAPATWLYAAGYLVLGVLLLGALARWWRHGAPALWRPAMLSLGSLAAAGEIALLAPGALAAPLERWMLALLGLIGAALLARVVPPPLDQHWLGLERRADRGGD